MCKYWLAAIVLLAGCADSPTQHAGNSPPGTASPAARASESTGTQIRLALHKVMDTTGTGKVAGTYLLPDGYSATDEIKWIPDDYLTPVVGSSTLKSSDGRVVIESMSGLETNFGHSPAGAFGVDPPESVSGFLLRAWKKAHSDLKFTVIDKQDSDIPDATQNGAGFRMFGKRGVIKLQYVKDGATYQVKSHARIDVMTTIPETTAIGGTMYEGGWVISNAYTVTAPKEQLPEAMKLFGIVLASYRIDPHFFNTVMQARDIIQRNFYGRLGQIMETSRIISQTNDEISASIDSAYKATQATEDREATNFDDTIRGIDRYQESEGDVSLPSGYAHAWSDGNGTYIVTDQALYDPNVSGPGGTWHEMEK